jgi:hypothetical protein
MWLRSKQHEEEIAAYFFDVYLLVFWVLPVMKIHGQEAKPRGEFSGQLKF